MNISFQIKNGELLDAMGGLADSVRIELKGSCTELDRLGRKTWSNLVSRYGTLSKGRNGREWFSLDRKKWFLTNEWLVPDEVWSLRNFVVGKRKQAEKSMKAVISAKKGDILNKSVERAFSKF